jgi:DNA mismatch repair protein MutS
MWKTPKRQTQAPLQPLSTYTSVGLSGDRPPDPPQFRNYPNGSRDGTYSGSLLWALGSHGNCHGGAHPAALAAATPAGCQGHSARQVTITELLKMATCARCCTQRLKQIYDLERLAGRAGSGTANARDLVALADSFLSCRNPGGPHCPGESPTCKACNMCRRNWNNWGKPCDRTWWKSPLYLTEGHLIRDGVNAQLDDLRQQVR